MFASANSGFIGYNSPMSKYQTTGNPNVMDLFVVVVTCLAVLFLAFPLNIDAQACGKAESASAQPAKVEKAVQPVSEERAEPPVAKAKREQPVKREKSRAPVKVVHSEPLPLQEKQPQQAKTEQEASAVESSGEKQIAVDIESLKTRLKETDAIGVFTKLAIRSDILDLVDEINRHRKKNKLELKIAEMRASFDGLLLKMVALLERDPNLSRDLYVSRESIWKSLLEVKV